MVFVGFAVWGSTVISEEFLHDEDLQCGVSWQYGMCSRFYGCNELWCEGQ